LGTEEGIRGVVSGQWSVVSGQAEGIRQRRFFAQTVAELFILSIFPHPTAEKIKEGSQICPFTSISANTSSLE